MEAKNQENQIKGNLEEEISDLEEMAVAVLLSTKSRQKTFEDRQIIFDAPKESPVCILLNHDLWKKFDHVGNEMIITRNGRCLFPTLKLSFRNLHLTEKYRVGLEFEQLSLAKLKFIGDGRSDWEPSSLPSAKLKRKLDKFSWISASNQLYFFGDSEQSGSFWMDQGANFSSVKLTNRNLQASEAQKGIFSLSSFHLYQPKIHLISGSQSWSFAFSVTKFIAVTHYQNPQVNFLKKIHNPHAKGFKLALEAADPTESE